MSASDFTATVKARGQIFTSWENLTVKRNFDDGISVFELSPAEGSYGPGYAGFKLQPGDAVEISLGGQKVISGAVTTRSVAYDDRSHQLVISGKSKTLHLAKSSVVVKPGNFDSSTFEQAARSVMAPHPVKLIMQNPPAIASKPFADLAIQYGERVSDFISRIACMRGLNISDDADGNLVASQGNPSAAAVAELREGVNILRATGVFDNQTAWGQLAGSGQETGGDQNWPPRAHSASVTNSDYPANWSHLFIAEHPGDSEDLAARVNYEQTQSLLATVRVTITVVGWLKPDGTLWQPTENVSVYSPMLFPEQSGLRTLGIQSVTYGQDSQAGTFTTLELVRPDLLSRIPVNGVTDFGGPGKPLNSAKPDEPDYSLST